jgi:hypothetical protein
MKRMKRRQEIVREKYSHQVDDSVSKLTTDKPHENS